MKGIRFGVVLGLALTVCLGAGCRRKTVPEFTPSPSSTPISVSPTPEGGNAATGGIDATVTPSLDTRILAASLPDPAAFAGSSADKPVERKTPVPLQDGTRTEFASLERNYVKANPNGNVTFRVTISDTRSIPVLSAFTKNFTEFSNDEGYRKRETVEGTDVWILYTNDPAKERGGFGGLTMLYRGRFLIQIDGSMGASPDDLLTLVKAFDFSQLR